AFVLTLFTHVVEIEVYGQRLLGLQVRQDRLRDCSVAVLPLDVGLLAPQVFQVGVEAVLDFVVDRSAQMQGRHAGRERAALLEDAEFLLQFDHLVDAAVVLFRAVRRREAQVQLIEHRADVDVVLFHEIAHREPSRHGGALLQDATQFKPRVCLSKPPLRHREPAVYFLSSTPRRIWSSSMLSNSALKFPSPKPSSPLRWMNSKKIGPSWFSLKICSSNAPFLPSTRILRFCSCAMSSPWLGMRLSISS